MISVRKTSVRTALAFLILVAPAQASAGQLDERLTTLSNAGSGEAAYHLGMLHHMGLAGVPKDQRKAFELFKLAADRGDPLGAYKVGCFYDGQGDGVVKGNPQLALKYKLVAAEAGYNLAQEDVSKRLFDTGDTTGALRWLEAAAAQGDRMALGFLGAMYSGLLPPDNPAPKASDPVKGWAYMLLSARDTPEIRTALETELAKRPAEERKRVKAFVHDWRAQPSALSQRTGIESAYKLVGLTVPKA